MTGTEPKHRDWVKLWVKDSLIGTIREDLTPAERGTWYDFLLLAGSSRIPGVICANKTTPVPPRRIAGILNIDEELVNVCTRKFEETGRITIDKNGVISIVNWSKYQYSDYDRQKPYREKAREQARKQAANHPGENHALNEYLAELRPNYPGLDLDDELVRFHEHWSQPGKNLKRPKQALKNWLDNAKEFKKPLSSERIQHYKDD